MTTATKPTTATKSPVRAAAELVEDIRSAMLERQYTLAKLAQQIDQLDACVSEEDREGAKPCVKGIAEWKARLEGIDTEIRGLEGRLENVMLDVLTVECGGCRGYYTGAADAVEFLGSTCEESGGEIRLTYEVTP